MKEIVTYFYNDDTNVAYKSVSGDKRYIMFIKDGNRVISETDKIHIFAEIIDLPDDESVFAMLEKNEI